MRKHKRHDEKGSTLLLAILALLLLSAIAMGMAYMSGTETAINANFKAEETAYFAARAGVEEVRDRLLTTNSNTLSAVLPTTLPGTANGVLYVLQSGVTAANVTNLSLPTGDDELCHDYTISGMTAGVPATVRCPNLPTGTTWYRTATSVAPYPLEYKWVRVTLKQNNSGPYCVDGTVPGTACTNSNQVCFNGASEVVLPTGTANCAAMTPTANPVYLATALAVTPSGARRLVQQELAQQPGGVLPGGLFAVGSGCSAMQIAGNAQTGSFNSSTESTLTNPPGNLVNNNGNVGANGNTYLGGSSTNVNGTISTNQPPSVGSCPGNGVSVAGSPGYGGISNFATPFSPPVPPMPNPLPPTTSVIYRNTTLAAGSYGNVTMQGTVTLTGGTVANPAVYTLNSLTLNGNCNLVITGPVVINLAGVGVTTALDMTGGSFSNTTYKPSNFVINYGGTDSMVVSGGNNAFAVIDAPNSALSFRGGSNFYGQAIAQTVDDRGGTNFYWDQSLQTVVPSNASFYEIAMRELSY